MKNIPGRVLCSSVFVCALVLSVISAIAAELPPGYKLLYQQSCATPEAIKDFVFSDPNAWRISKDEKGELSLEQFAKSAYVPKDRSPFNIAVVANQVFGSFILEAELLSTIKPYPHQDMCVFFGFEATNKFYYAHLGLKRDALAHNITIVNDAPRAVIPTKANDGVTWEQNVWHKIRLERNTNSGAIHVYFDNGPEPVLSATNKTFGLGFIGFGSFDDKGRIRNIKVYGPEMKKCPAAFFRPAK